LDKQAKWKLVMAREQIEHVSSRKQYSALLSMIRKSDDDDDDDYGIF